MWRLYTWKHPRAYNTGSQLLDEDLFPTLFPGSFISPLQRELPLGVGDERPCEQGLPLPWLTNPDNLAMSLHYGREVKQVPLTLIKSVGKGKGGMYIIC